MKFKLKWKLKFKVKIDFEIEISEGQQVAVKPQNERCEEEEKIKGRDQGSKEITMEVRSRRK